MEATKRNYHSSYLELAEKMQNLELINQRLNKEKQELNADNDALKEIIAEKDRVIANNDKKYKSLSTSYQVFIFYIFSFTYECILGKRI